MAFVQTLLSEIGLHWRLRRGLLSEKASRLHQAGILIGEAQISFQLQERFRGLMTSTNQVQRDHHPVEFFDEYDVPQHLAHALMEEAWEELETVEELNGGPPVLRDGNAVVNVTKPQTEAKSSYVFHHDNKLRHYRLILLLDAADEESATQYLLFSNRPIRRLLFWRRKQLSNGTMGATRVERLALGAGSYYIIDTCGWHRAGIPERTRRAVVNLCFDPARALLVNPTD